MEPVQIMSFTKEEIELIRSSIITRIISKETDLITATSMLKIFENGPEVDWHKANDLQGDLESEIKLLERLHYKMIIHQDKVS